MITRIRELLEARQLSPTQFADLIGVGRPVISHILSERNKPSLEVVQKIIGAFPELSLPWLLAGTGPMLAAAAPPLSAPPIATEAMQPPALAAPTTAATVPPAAAPIIRPAAPARSVAPPQPSSSYPQPPRFRAGAPALASPAGTDAAISPIEAPAETANSIPVASALPSSTPLPAPAAATYAAAVANPALVPATPPLPPATMPTPPADDVRLPASSLPAEAPAPSSSSETPSLPPNPAAALSFLGEPGKAIRRIVIFYRDGSFSDYLPEGS